MPLFTAPEEDPALNLIFESLRGSDSLTPESSFTLHSLFVSLPTAGKQPGPIPVLTSKLSNLSLGQSLKPPTAWDEGLDNP